MPNANTWGLLPKSLSDNQIIADYFAAQLAIHNADDSAHGQSDEAIYNHRITSILDHLNESVLAQHIKALNVTTKKLVLDGSVIIENWEGLTHLENWSSGSETTSLNPAIISGACDNVTNSTWNYAGYCAQHGSDFGAVDIVFQSRVKFGVNSFTAPDNQEASFGIGVFTFEYIGFVYYNSKLYARVCTAETNYDTEIVGITYEVWNNYRIEHYHGDRDDFYINEVLVHSETEHPAVVDPGDMWYDFKTKTLNNVPKSITVSTTIITFE